MTRRDYIFLAQCFRDSLARFPGQRIARLAIQQAALDMCAALARNNPKFDPDRFLTACGVEQ